MAKKKKKNSKAKDARGYGTTTSTTSSSSTTTTTRLPKPPKQPPSVTSITTTNNKNNNKNTTKATKKIEISYHAQNDLVSLLNDLQITRTYTSSSTFIKPVSYTKNKRFLKKITIMYHTLSSLYFTDAQIEQALTSLHLVKEKEKVEEEEEEKVYTIEKALDWLCMHVKSEELPVLFTEVAARENSMEGSSGSSRDGKISVVVVGTAQAKPFETKKQQEEEQTQKQELECKQKEELERQQQQKQREEEEERKKEELLKKKKKEEAEEAAAEENAKQKQWLLNQYQYESDSSSTSQHSLEKEKEEISDSTTPEEKRLYALKTEYKSLQEELRDDVCNYMRSKYELKEMKKRKGQLEKLMRGMEVKMEKQKRKKQQQQQQQEEEEEAKEGDAAVDMKEEEEEEGCMLSLFGNSNSDDDDDEDYKETPPSKPPPTTPSLPPPPSPPPKPSPTYTSLVNNKPHPSTSKLYFISEIQSSSSSSSPKSTDYFIPSSWTGKTPKLLLQEWCKKYLLLQHGNKKNSSQPKYSKVGEGRECGCALIIPLSSSFSSSSTTTKNNNNKKMKKEEEQEEQQQLTIKDDGPYPSYTIAQEFLATEALYLLQNNNKSSSGSNNNGVGVQQQNLYRLLPPFFRNVWLYWVTLESEKKRKEEEVLEGDFLRKMEGLVKSIEDVVNNNRGVVKEGGDEVKDEKVEKKMAGMVKEEVKDEVLDSWEDDDDDDYNDDYVKPLPTIPVSPPSSKSPPLTTTTPSTTTTTTTTTTAASAPTKTGLKLRDLHQKHTSTPLYQKYHSIRSALPIYSHRTTLLQTIRSNQVTVLCAETGAGKTTQCPQYILEDYLEKGLGDAVNIICTQPRRISALSVAERVATEMNVELGTTVGYSIRNETKRSAKKTKLLFCTTGVVLRKLQNENEDDDDDDTLLKGVSHVVVDEVHERQWQIDFLLIALRRLIFSGKRKDLKIVLMSATLDSKLFCNFFPGSPFLQIPGRTFPVSQYHLEDLLDATNHIIEEGSRCAIRDYKRGYNTGSVWVTGKGGEKHKENVSFESEVDLGEVSEEFVGYKMSTRRSMERVDEKVINYDLIEDLLHLLLVEAQHNNPIIPPPHSSSEESVPSQNNNDDDDGSILIFLPGLGEIRSLSDRLKGSRTFGNTDKFQIVMMHSTLSPKDQKRAFAKMKEGCRKIILATNIAETSVTIPDVVCVIDSGLVKEVRQNKRSGTSMLVTDWCSRASAKQRSGRAGRVRPGICCKLFSSRTADRIMKDQAMPELQRVPLEEVCLGILAGGLANNCMDFLLQAPQPPTEESVQTALVLLEEVGAIELENVTNDGDGRIETLTPLGRHLAKIPVHVKLGKMLIFGALFKCLDKILTVAASLSSKSLFSTYIDDANQAASAHRSFVHPSSDFLTICNVWDGYCLASSKSRSEGRRFCDKYYLSQSALMGINDARREFVDLLRQIGFVKGDDFKRDRTESWSAFHEKMSSSGYNINGNNEALLNSVIFAGLYPNVAHGTSPVGVGSNAPPTFWHKKEQVYLHSSSVNHKQTKLESEWIAFHEKFATSKVYLSATCLVKPFSLILFGRSVSVLHVDRKVIVDDWIELKVAAQTGVMFRELRNEVEYLLKEMIEGVNKGSSGIGEKGERMINGLVRLITNE